MYDNIKIYLAPNGLNHDTAGTHPECPKRLTALMELLQTPPYQNITRSPVSAAKNGDILRVHSAAHLSLIEESQPDSGEYEYIDGDTIMSEGSYQAALHAAGAVSQAVSDINSNKAKIGLCPNRPPGHHACHNQAMGFCLFNNVMIGAAKAVDLGFKKIAIVDFDVHHGNGCQDILNYVDLPVFYISTHQAMHYPGTGYKDENIDNKLLNLPLDAGCTSSEMRQAYQDHIFPAIATYQPDLIMISAGFDAHKDDPYGGFNWVDDDYFWLSHEIAKLAKTHAQGRIISVLEGGYNLEALKNSYAAHINGLMAA